MFAADTIAAVASAPAGGGRAIVRISGPEVLAVVLRCFRPASVDDLSAAEFPARRPGELAIGGSAPLTVPCDLYLWPRTRSYTREQLAELHLPGSAPLAAAALQAVCTAGARLAAPGEFTLRAFLAGRLDLTQAEAVLGVIDARGQSDLTAALGQLAGGISQPLTRLRDSLLDLLAHLEAGLDFVEDDIRFIAPEELDAQLAAGEAQVAELLAKLDERGDLADLPRVALAGRPNAGKSSLFNALAARFAAPFAATSRPALVSPAAGTTRDYLEVELTIDGERFLLVDTAGIKSIASAPSGSTIEGAAQAMAGRQSESAELRVVCMDASSTNDESMRRELEGALDLVIWTKCDLADNTLGAIMPGGMRSIATSSVTGAGLAELAAAITDSLRRDESRPLVVSTTATRCRESVRLAAVSLRQARESLEGGHGEEIVAAELRIALNELGQVVGAVYTDDILDRIFSRFCIGK